MSITDNNRKEGWDMRVGEVRLVRREELLEMAKRNIVLFRIGAGWVELSGASKEWIERTLPDIGFYEVVKLENGWIKAQYVG